MAKQKKRDSVVKEAWNNMNEDFNRFMPEGLRKKKGKKKFVLWLFIVELVVLGIIGKIIYQWLFG